MFTGLVECMGTLRSVRSEGLAKRFVVEAPFCRELSTGESIAIDGIRATAMPKSLFHFIPIKGTMATTITRSVIKLKGCVKYITIARAKRATVIGMLCFSLLTSRTEIAKANNSIGRLRR